MSVDDCAERQTLGELKVQFCSRDVIVEDVPRKRTGCRDDGTAGVQLAVEIALIDAQALPRPICHTDGEIARIRKIWGDSFSRCVVGSHAEGDRAVQHQLLRACGRKRDGILVVSKFQTVECFVRLRAKKLEVPWALEVEVGSGDAEPILQTTLIVPND